MPTTEIIQNVINVGVVLGMVFTVYKSIRTPQEKTEKQDAVMTEQFRQIKLDFTNLCDNHIHSLDLKIDATISSLNTQALEIAKLTTIIAERIPKK